jgi:hypothetical protein
MVGPTFLIIPRNDGVVVSIDGVLRTKRMDATQMLNLALQCLNVGLEMKRNEEAQQTEDTEEEPSI